jgi:hypothetical protein
MSASQGDSSSEDGAVEGEKAVARIQDIIFWILLLKPLSEIDDLCRVGKSNLVIKVDRCAHLDVWKELRKTQFFWDVEKQCARLSVDLIILICVLAYY